MPFEAWESGVGDQWNRVLYIARFAEAVYVLHAFQKKARATGERDIELARTRYAELRRGRHD
ncbi:MAG: type II toxin-antitoxin system RelE/ParE family toxin [Nitrospira sp.]|nr:type II toxin-antitoxin system RelE/ParE family toxin [Nitrospira sp.]